MQITHEEAHKLIQFNADSTLKSQGKAALSAHLENCIECRSYAEEITEVESILLPVMQRQWNIQPAPLSISTIRVKRNTIIQTSIILATRIVAVGVVLLTFIFSVWQFTISGGGKAHPSPVSVLPVPIPSAQSTSTKITFQNCDGKLYIVQEHDTLASIASQFSTSKEDLMAANNMQAETVRTGMELLVPVCKFTPTGTIHPTTLITTYTPSVSPTTFTPDG